MYNILRSFLFLFNPEWVHHFSMNSLQFICKIPFGKAIIKSLFQPAKSNSFSLFNIQFPNKLGLGAGFDKNALYLNELQALGFGFVEIGTVTPRPQAGNEKPRLFRLPKDKALINRMGFNNDGVALITQRLQEWKKKNPALIIGGNIGKNKTTPNEDAWVDYAICFNELHPYVDYFVVNVSSPNTPGLRELQEKDSLRKILTTLQQLQQQSIVAGQWQVGNQCWTNTNGEWVPTISTAPYPAPLAPTGSSLQPKPILLKIAPDLTTGQINDVIELALEIKLDGLVVSNTTIDRTRLTTDKSVIEKIGAGGVSGLPAKARSTEIVQYIAQKTKGQIPLIASGGIFTAADAKEKINAGASLVQVWTGFIYEGPSIVKNICNHL